MSLIQAYHINYIFNNKQICRKDESNQAFFIMESIWVAYDLF